MSRDILFQPDQATLRDVRRLTNDPPRLACDRQVLGRRTIPITTTSFNKLDASPLHLSLSKP